MEYERIRTAIIFCSCGVIALRLIQGSDTLVGAEKYPPFKYNNNLKHSLLDTYTFM